MAAKFHLPPALIMAIALTGTGITKVLAQAIPPPFQGQWSGSLQACRLPVEETRLEITPGELHFYESRAQVTSVNRASNTEIIVGATFAGEGETWQESIRLRLSSDGQTLTTLYPDHTSFTRYRCP